MTDAPSEGPRVIRWIEKHCRYGEGDRFGEPVRLETFQKIFLIWLFELRPDGRRRYRRSLFEVPKGNGKTPLAAWIAAYLLATQRSPVIPVAAASYEQAGLLFGDLQACIAESPTLSTYFDVFEGEVQVRSGPGRAYKVAAIAGSNDGQRPSAFFPDEIHEWTGNKERVHLVIGNGCAKREGSLVVNTSTPGYDLETLLGRLHLHGLEVNAGKVRDEEFLFVWWGCPDGEFNLDDPEQLRAAIRRGNPAADLFLNVEDVASRYYQIRHGDFLRYHLAQWTQAEESWLPPGAWDLRRVARELVAVDVDRPAWVGVDMALKHDSTAVQVVQLNEPGEGPRVRAPGPRIWRPDGDRIDVASVENHLRGLHRLLGPNLREVAYDPAYFQRSAEVLLDEGLPMVEFTQSHALMVPASMGLYELIVQGELAHDGDPILREHILAAAVRETDQGWRLSKGRSRRQVDGCIALAIACARALAAPPASTPSVYEGQGVTWL